MTRDIEAFLATDWAQVVDTFVGNDFVGYVGSSNPDQWAIRYPTLESYRDDWLRQSREFRAQEFPNLAHREVLVQASTLDHIEIVGSHAAAHKKFRFSTQTSSNAPFRLDWQTIYWLRFDQETWRITGFLGYLPNGPLEVGSSRAKPPRATSAITAPPQASQHLGAGPYSPVLHVAEGRLIVLSGQGPIDSAGRIVGSAIGEQTQATLENCRRLLKCAGADFKNVFRTMVYLRDMRDWSRFNEVYKLFFEPPYPARTAVQAVLWGDISVEIELSAMIEAGA